MTKRENASPPAVLSRSRNGQRKRHVNAGQNNEASSASNVKITTQSTSDVGQIVLGSWRNRMA